MLLVGAHFYFVGQLGDDAVLLPQVSFHGLQVRLEERVLLQSVIPLFLQGDRLCVQLLFLKRLDVVRHVLLARGVISSQVVGESGKMAGLSGFNTFADLGEEARVAARDWVRRNGPSSLPATLAAASRAVRVVAAEGVQIIRVVRRRSLLVRGDLVNHEKRPD